MAVRIILKNGIYSPQSNYGGKDFSNVPRNQDYAPYEFTDISELHIRFPEWINAEVIKIDNNE